ncbi:flagellar basal-body rod protein flgF [Candidatus Photodesmus katoptron]|uniref:Flagellar basal-body rod protein FlgF n=1 Tax=Candidatus Photodesmus katoptron Akat1 TaxID=1236703 RepID=S3DLD3_9GAMM|nr:flagellar basal body rod protein FlgF [Candidatus Photodesmus katoptron]EPE37964.1 flagellar basal-body rod protein FlgF [Candidatus Photodesmus katoptron Akat1]KEY90250.1 flagellar basal-body rod protein flgF [Candidatus Photodesmus katoptron]
MDRALFLGMNGAKQTMQAMKVSANNLANVSTTAFRADLAQARAMPAYGNGVPSRVFSMTERSGQNFSKGSMVTTGYDLDIMIQGNGWISVIDESGHEGLTRNGNFIINQDGLLTNSSGHLVLGDSDAPIALPIPVSKVEISNDGSISVILKGAPANSIETINRIKLVNLNQESLFKDFNGLLRLKERERGNEISMYQSDESVKLLSGSLEGSNVNAIEEMTNLIALQRQFETQIKIMSTAEDMDKASDLLFHTN